MSWPLASQPANQPGLREPEPPPVDLRNARDWLRDRAIIAVLLGCALRRCEVAALTDGRSSRGFTLEATVAARHANTPDLSRCGDGTH